MHVILTIAEQMAEEGAVVKKQHRTTSTSSKKRTKVHPWSAEETHALVEGVKQFGDSPSGFRAILRDQYFSTIFEGQFRNLKQLASRWDKINIALKSGTILEKFIEEEVQAEEEIENNTELDTNDKENSGNEVNAEKELDYEQILRSFLNFQTMYNLFVMVDPSAPPPNSPFRDLSSKESHYHYIVAVHIQRLRTFSKGMNERESLEPMLWNLGLFIIYERILTTLKEEIKSFSKSRKKGPKDNNTDDDLILPSYMTSLPGGSNFSGTRHLILILESVVRHFIKHSKENPLIFAEILFSQQKQDTISISVFYEDEFTLRQRKAMEIEEQRRLFYENLEKEQGLVGESGINIESSRFLQDNENEDIGEVEATFDDYKPPEPTTSEEDYDGVGNVPKVGEKRKRNLILEEDEEDEA